MNIPVPALATTRPHVVIIGGGIAGLAACLDLTVAGYRVTLLERHEHLGGKIRTLPTPAGPVDAGPTVLTMRHVFDALMLRAGTCLDDHVTLVQQDTVARHHWPDGSQLDLFHDQDASVAAVRAFAGEKSASEFQSFCKKTAALFDAFDAPMMQSASPNLAELAFRSAMRPGLLPALLPGRTLRNLLRSQFSDPRLAQLFGRYATYVGGAPGRAPAVLSLIWQAEASGVWVVDGGMHKLAEAIGNMAMAHGAAIRTAAHVDEIVVRGGHAAGVALASGETLGADAVLFAGDPRALATGALGTAVSKVARVTKKAARSFSARVHSFAATPNGPDLAHHNVFFDADPDSEFDDLLAGRIPRDPSIYICALDRGLNRPPPTLERFEIITNAPAITSRNQLISDLETWNRKIIQKMANARLTFHPTPNSSHVTTEVDFARLFPKSQGALYGQTPHGQTASLQRPRARSPIPGLYLAGGGCHPGAGVPMATLSARHAVEAILSDQTLTSTSPRTAMPGGMSTA